MRLGLYQDAEGALFFVTGTAHVHGYFVAVAIAQDQSQTVFPVETVLARWCWIADLKYPKVDLRTAYEREMTVKIGGQVV